MISEEDNSEESSFVCHAIAPIREKYPAMRCVHYMDDILLNSKELKLLHLAYRDLVKTLERKGLYIASEKVQQEHLVIFPRVTCKEPIKDAVNIFTDGSKTGCGAYVTGESAPVVCHFLPGSPQIVEFQIVLEVIKRVTEALNLISDSIYVVNLVKDLEVAGKIKVNSPIQNYVNQLQEIIWKHSQPFYIQHIRAHTGLPGAISEKNDLVDKCTRMQFAFTSLPLDRAQQFHSQFHVNSKTLKCCFGISDAAAHDIVKACKDCVTFLQPPARGVNPRGLTPFKLWQMDVTHIPEFGTINMCIYLWIPVLE
ncbi:putative Pol polyprotein [Cricetulus griseus]|uniref:Putative Pol polyprotein n=1 Tax=Cricetulus griseus TaxID=10029 RepID=A0A061I043_CRIGR|nr:putative Pol polyprotein [Cricetulus griseus]